jgi:hypothetical protein
MRARHVCLTLSALLTACGPAMQEGSNSARAVRVIYARTAPCPANFLPAIQGRDIYDLQRQAYARNANAVLVDTAASAGTLGAPMSATPITWVQGTCDK